MEISEEIKSNKCIILDIDGTLIDSLTYQVYTENKNDIPRKPDFITDDKDCMFKRPGLDVFIKFCFDNFKHVAIWTASGKQWAQSFVSHIIQPQYRHKFAFVWDNKRLSKRIQVGYFWNHSNSVIRYKPLYKVWRSKKRKKAGWLKEYTLIIEDTPRNCMANYGNAIYIDSFEILDETHSYNDTDLIKLMQYLSALLNVNTVRNIEKRYWKEMIKFLNETDKDENFNQYCLTRFIKHNIHSLALIEEICEKESKLKEIEIEDKEYRIKLTETV